MLLLIFSLSLIFLICLAGHIISDEGRWKRWLGIGSVAALLAICSLSLLKYEFHEDLSSPSLKLNLKYGLDIQGGTQFTLELAGNPTPAVRNQAISVIRSRIDGLGLNEPIIQSAGDNRIIVQIPGVSESEKLRYRSQLERVAKLEFRIVHPESETLVNSPPETWPIGYEALPLLQKSSKESKEPSSQPTLLVKRRSEMSGKYVDMAFRGIDEVGRPVVIIEFTPEGKELFRKLTRENKGQRMAIILDNEIYSAPVINTEIIGSCEISGGSMTPNEAEELANILQNPLETPVKILDERSVDPSLGRDSVRSGFQASLIALIAVIIFTIFYYRVAGVIATISLLFNMVVLIGLLAQLGFTLTMPGLAGIILTIGMAVDANVLIYERIREEINSGKSLKAALVAGFDKAFSSILDANVTTIIAAIILFWQGSGPIQGFAVTLCLGVLGSVFSALILTRLQFDWLMQNSRITSLKMARFIADKTNFDFMGVRWAAISASVVCLLICLFVIFQRSERILGVDFVGGSLMTYRFEEKISDENIRKAIPQMPVTAQYMEAGDNQVLALRAPYGKADEIEKTLTQRFPEANLQRLSLDNVEGIVGKELQKKAFIALTFGLTGIFLYIMWRFETRFAIGAVVAVLHDVLISLGLFILFGRELSLPVVGAILTVAGYSINDTIVIFDRIRESLRHHGGGSLVKLMNDCVNQTLSRTLITSGTTFIAVLALYLFGGVVINDFALILLIGIVVGTYSSIFIATPIVLMLDPRRAFSTERERIASTAPASTS